MAIRSLGQSGCPVTSLSASVCVVGAGIAGLIVASRLARSSNRRIIVVESGQRSPNAVTEPLNESPHPAATYPALVARSRGLGGTSPLWAGLSTGAVVGGLLDMRYGESAFLFPAALAAILALIAIVLTVAKPGSTLVAGSSPAPDASPKAEVIDAIR